MGIATQVETAIDNMLNTFVNSTSSSVCSMLSPIAITGATIYLLTLSFAVARGEAQDPLHTTLKSFFRMSLVGAIALSGGTYQNLIVQGLQGVQGAFISAFSSATSIGGLVDNMAEPFNTLGQQLWSEATTGVMPNFALLTAAAIVALAESFLFIVGLGMYLLTKVAFALTLAVGPAFVLGAMFPATQRFTESWMGQALGFTMVNVLLGACITMLTSFASQFAAHIQANVGNTAIMTDVLSLALVSGALGIVLLNIKTLATALTGGASISGIGRELTRYLMDKSRNSKDGDSSSSESAGGSISGASTSGNDSSSGAAQAGDKPIYQSRVIDNIKRSA